MFTFLSLQLKKDLIRLKPSQPLQLCVCVRNVIKNLLSIIRALTSDPMPDWGQPCSTEIRWFVFMTDLPMVSMSSGRKERRLMTSASIPWPASSLAASKHISTDFEWPTKVMCFPVQISQNRNKLTLNQQDTNGTRGWKFYIFGEDTKSDWWWLAKWVYLM